MLTRGGALAVAGVGAAYLGLRQLGSMDEHTVSVAATRAVLSRRPEVRDLIRYATLVPNGHNTQPWRFRISVRRVEILPDLTRRTPVVDPDDHHLFASLGCAAENFSLAAGARGLSTQICGFDWRAKVGPFGVVSGRDALKDGQGRFDIMALGIIPIARAEHSAALVRGQLMRYLAELPWAPDAILLNSALRWREAGAEGLVVGAGAAETAVEVALSLDPEGRIAGAFAPNRPRSATAPILPTPWRGRFSDYRWHEGRWLPFAGEVGWEIDGKESVYWQARIEQWETCARNGFSRALSKLAIHD